MRYLLLIVLFASCYTSKDALRDVNKAQRKHPEVVARFCSDTFPCVTSRIDTLTETEVEYITLKCPDDKYILDTIWLTNNKVVKGSAVIVNKNKTNTIIKTIRDSAEIIACELEAIALNNKCNQLTQDNQDLKDKVTAKNRWLMWLVIALLCSIIVNILLIKK
jgi:hypothetical protein